MGSVSNASQASSQSSKRGAASIVASSARSGSFRSSQSSRSSRREPGQPRNISRLEKTLYAQIKVKKVETVYSGINEFDYVISNKEVTHWGALLYCEGPDLDDPSKLTECHFLYHLNTNGYDIIDIDDIADTEKISWYTACKMAISCGDPELKMAQANEVSVNNTSLLQMMNHQDAKCNYKYDVLKNNCQHFVEEIYAFVKGR